MAKQVVKGLDRLRELLPNPITPPYPYRKVPQDPLVQAIEDSYPKDPKKK